MIKWINMCQCFLTFNLMLLRIYLQFICFNVATAICIISPPCLKRNQRNKLKQSIESIFSAQKHREAGLQSDLHSFPLNKSSLINSQLTLWLCQGFAFFLWCTAEIVPEQPTTNAWTITVIIQFSIQSYLPTYRAKGNSGQREERGERKSF